MAKENLSGTHESRQDLPDFYETRSETLLKILSRYRFFFVHASTRSSAFSIFSIEFATLKRR